MAPCPLNLKECKISFSQVKLASKVEFNFGWHTWKLHNQNCSILNPRVLGVNAIMVQVLFVH